MPGTVLGAGHTLLNKTDAILSSWSFPNGDQTEGSGEIGGRGV